MCSLFLQTQIRHRLLQRVWDLQLQEFVIEGIKTTIPFHIQLMQDERFRKGDYTTKFMDDFVLK